MKIKRILLKAFKRILALVLVIGIFTVATGIIYNNISSDELSIQKDYEARKEKCELLKKVANDFIEEGKGINIKEIPNENIEYNIYNVGENIIFSYDIKTEYSNKRTYSAKITLSKDYRILDEYYSFESLDYETYKRSIKVSDVLSSLELVLMAFASILLLIALLITLIVCISKIYLKHFEKKS